jgi:hypothetical protein
MSNTTTASFLDSAPELPLSASTSQAQKLGSLHLSGSRSEPIPPGISLLKLIGGYSTPTQLPQTTTLSRTKSLANVSCAQNAAEDARQSPFENFSGDTNANRDEVYLYICSPRGLLFSNFAS